MFAYPKISPDVFNPKEVYEAKLLLGYFLSSIDSSCAPDALQQIATESGIIDYFLYTEAITEMLKAGTLEEIDCEGEICYRLTEKGYQGVGELKRLVPKSVRDRIYASGMRLFTKLKNEQTVKIDITECDKGFMVRCIVHDSGVTLIDMSLFAPDMEQADCIRRKLQTNMTEIYSDILDYVVCSDDSENQEGTS